MALVAIRRASDEAGAMRDTPRNRQTQSLVASAQATIISNISARPGETNRQLKAEAEELFDSAIRLCSESDDPADEPVGLPASRVYDSIGNHFSKWSEFEKDIAAHEKGLAALANSPTDPPLVRRKKDMVRAQHLQGIGRASLEKGDTTGAKKALSTARDIRLRLHADERGAPLICADMASTRLWLARLHVAEGRAAEALTEVEAGLAVLSPWEHSRIPAVSEFRERLAALRDQLRTK